MQPAKKIGGLLIDAGVVTLEQIEQALGAVENGSYQRVGEALVGLEFISEENLRDVLADQLGYGRFDPQADHFDPTIAKEIGSDICGRHQMIPIGQKEKKLVVATADPANLQAIDDIRLSTGCDDLEILVATPSDFRILFDSCFGISAEMDRALAADRGTWRSDDLNLKVEASQLNREAESAPIINTVDTMLTGAARQGASDVHIDPGKDVSVVYYRIDGARQKVTTIRNDQVGKVIARIKILARLDTSERRKPQDGRIDLNADGKEIDIRVSIMPTVNGETVVMRLLNKSNANIKLTDLGFDESELTKFGQLVAKPHGIILITGPTGSGKSTTLTAALGKQNKPEVRILTVEDPVEYQIPGLNQVQVHDKIGLNFATAIRTFMRQDPDIIMVGEIRDYETAELAVNAALTGHLVFSTLHTNDAPGAIPRLINMKVPAYLINASIVGVMGQRLVRKLCQCKKSHEPTAEELEMVQKSIGNSPDFELPKVLYVPKGCSVCGGRGYKGRTGIFEVMLMTNEMRLQISQSSDIYMVKRLARQQGMRTLWESGLQKALKGITSMEELLRVARPDYEEGVPPNEPVTARQHGMLAEASPTLAEVESFSAL